MFTDSIVRILAALKVESFRADNYFLSSIGLSSFSKMGLLRSENKEQYPIEIS